MSTRSRPVVPSRRLRPSLGCCRSTTSAVCRHHETVGTANYDCHRRQRLCSFGRSHLEQSTSSFETIFLLNSDICTEAENFLRQRDVHLFCALQNSLTIKKTSSFAAAATIFVFLVWCRLHCRTRTLLPLNRPFLDVIDTVLGICDIIILPVWLQPYLYMRCKRTSWRFTFMPTDTFTTMCMYSLVIFLLPVSDPKKILPIW